MVKRARTAKKTKKKFQPDYTDHLERTLNVAQRVMQEYTNFFERNQIHVPCKMVIEKIWWLLPKYNYDLKDDRLRVDLSNSLKLALQIKKLSDDERYIFNVIISDLVSQKQ